MHWPWFGYPRPTQPPCLQSSAVCEGGAGVGKTGSVSGTSGPTGPGVGSGSTDGSGCGSADGVGVDSGDAVASGGATGDAVGSAGEGVVSADGSTSGSSSSCTAWRGAELVATGAGMVGGVRVGV